MTFGIWRHAMRADGLAQLSTASALRTMTFFAQNASNQALTVALLPSPPSVPPAAGANPMTTDPAHDGLKVELSPWQDFHGDLPDYDHPVRCVFESGIQYAVELLAKELKVDDWQPCDGTEEFDGDLGGTLMNIVLAAMPKDEHGDPMWPQDVRAALTRTATRANEDEVEAMVWAFCSKCNRHLPCDQTGMCEKCSLTAGSDWFAGDVDCDGNELVTLPKDELDKYKDQVRHTCDRAEKAEARATKAEAEVEALKRLVDAWVQWEAAVILDAAPWHLDSGFAVSGDHYDRYVELQVTRQEALRASDGGAA
jgi:hypothetical protein